MRWDSCAGGGPGGDRGLQTLRATDATAHVFRALVGLALVACADDRERVTGEGVHPIGWADEEHPAFHAKWLEENGDDLERCRTCHGEDYRGGAVGKGCAGTGCHEDARGPEACGTCHGSDTDNPLPETGPHAKHEAYCESCHRVPEHVDDACHIDDEGCDPEIEAGGPGITFSDLALQDGATPTFDRESKTCDGTYCHVGGSPTWEEREDPLPCDACHEAPPDSHERFARVTIDEDGVTLLCETCHPIPPGDTHVDGAPDIDLPDGCDACHGAGDDGAPPPALDGATEPDERGSGAHARHLDPFAPNRVRDPVPCESCHTVPTEDDVLGEDHIDTDAPADVTLPGNGTWDPDAATCANVWCHGDGTPDWTRDSGDPDCGGCHGDPPDNHLPFEATVEFGGCDYCHPELAADAHVDGDVDLDLNANVLCGTCHGSAESPAPPVGVDREGTGSAVGAHQAHLTTGYAPIPCETCHTVPTELHIDGTDGHIDEDGRAEVTLPSDPRHDNQPGVYDPDTRSCTVWCHFGNEDRARPIWDVQATGDCGTCHDLPPGSHLGWDWAEDLGFNIYDCTNCHDDPRSQLETPTHVNGEVD